MIVPFEIETGEPENDPAFRSVTLKLGGVVIFTDFVYDTDGEGNRTEEQAQLNGLRLFSHRLRRLMEED